MFRFVCWLCIGESRRQRLAEFSAGSVGRWELAIFPPPPAFDSWLRWYGLLPKAEETNIASRAYIQ